MTMSPLGNYYVFYEIIRGKAPKELAKEHGVSVKRVLQVFHRIGFLLKKFSKDVENSQNDFLDKCMEVSTYRANKCLWLPLADRFWAARLKERADQDAKDRKAWLDAKVKHLPFGARAVCYLTDVNDEAKIVHECVIRMRVEDAEKDAKKFEKLYGNKFLYGIESVFTTERNPVPMFELNTTH